jgi:lipid A 3-O-deacylase
MKRAFFITFLLFSILSCSRQNRDQYLKKINDENQPLKSEISKRRVKTTTASVGYDQKGNPVKSHGKKQSDPVSVSSSGKKINPDKPGSPLQDKLEYLRSMEAEIDLNEPVSKLFFSSSLPPAEFPRMILLSREHFLKISFDNDIIDYTDRFYTNGIRIDLISPFLAGNPVGKILVPYWGSGMNYYGLSIVQNLYTPSTTKTGGILYGDRPYAAYLYLGSFKITNDPFKRFRLSSELDLGIIGPYSFGEWVQRSFHDVAPGSGEPLGWEYQVQNDLVLNYQVTFDKGVFEQKGINLNLVSTASLGTLYTNISGGFQLRAGWMNPYFANLGIARRERLSLNHLQKAQCYFFLKGSGKLVGYDATLEGGMINKSSVYTMPASNLSRLVFQTSAGLTITYGGFLFEAEQLLLSPEFTDGLWHKWVHIGISFCF